jgi:Secretion system C-terminal sorting domain
MKKNLSLRTTVLSIAIMLTTVAASAQCTGTTISQDFKATPLSSTTTFIYVYNGMVNGKCSFVHFTTPTTGASICWSGTQWDIYSSINCSGTIIWHSNVNTTDRPPDLSFGSWVQDNAAVMISLTGTGTTSGSPLAVKLLSFTGNAAAGKNILQWATATETNNHHFDIERSTNAIDFEKLGTVAGAGNSYTIKNYGFTDESPLTGTNYYRLNQTGINGKFEYSAIIALKNTGNGTLSIYPNPAGGQLFINGLKNKPNNYKITNTLGQVMQQGNAAPNKPINVQTLNTGTYYILTGGNAVKFMKK